MAIIQKARGVFQVPSSKVSVRLKPKFMPKVPSVQV